ncbi:hypothetical protein BD779DRAFT_826010 [Infundibulicybe gibba]|nr:hypothetical protein BD779DRAFT_826010 [Infundibulicybe gibba]
MCRSADEQYFWNGELRSIANQHAEPRLDGKPTFRLTTVLGNKSELAFAIMSSYSLDFAWIYEFFDRNVPVIMVAQPDSTGRLSLKNVLPNWIKTTPALRDGRGCMHMKFMLLFYKTGRLRVVVTTANLIAYDYRDIGDVGNNSDRLVILLMLEVDSLVARLPIAFEAYRT